MASPAVSTPLKSHSSIFSTRTAGGRLPLTPSPRSRTQTVALNDKPVSPFTPSAQDEEPLFTGKYSARVSRSVSKTSVRDSPKSNIAHGNNTPRRIQAAGSDFTLHGTGHSAQTPSKARSVRPRPTKTTVKVGYNAADRFIPNRTASEGLVNSGASKIDRPKSSKGEGSRVLAEAANTFDIGVRNSVDDAAAALEGLDIDDDEAAPSYTKPTPDAVAYESSLANACGVSLNTRILAFKPAPPESSKPIDLRSQYNRPLKPAAAASTQFRRKVLSAPERVLDAPGILDDYYLNLLDILYAKSTHC